MIKISDNLNIYGHSPYRICVVHGGPGAAGEMAPVARELASSAGILEPLQTADSVQGQIVELKNTLEIHGKESFILVGYSWGAWLCWMMAAQYPELVKKLILVSSGPFEEQYAERIYQTRMNRLSKEEKRKVELLGQQIHESESDVKDEMFGKFGLCIGKADTYESINNEPEEIMYSFHIFEKVWPEADAMRKSGKLLEQGKKIQCPVVVIHGDYDPHPAEGVREPLSQILKDFRFVLLKKCGHKPWIEKYARKKFFEILRSEIIL